MGLIHWQGDVVITLSQGDFEILDLALGYAAEAASKSDEQRLFESFIRLANAVHEGDPAWTPYRVEALAVKREAREGKPL